MHCGKLISKEDTVPNHYDKADKAEKYVIISTHSPSSLTISARMAGVDLAFLFSSTEHKQTNKWF